MQNKSRRPLPIASTVPLSGLQAAHAPTAAPAAMPKPGFRVAKTLP